MIVGLDIETTGSKPIKPLYRTIQIGIAFGVLDTFVSDVGWESFEFDPEARKVNKFTDLRVECANPASYVQDSAVAAMLAHGALPDFKRRATAVGWNVGSFDLEYLAKDMPKLAALFGVHAIDLNSICYGLGGETGAHEWKQAAKEHSLRLVGTNQAHDAGWDAISSLIEYHWLREQVRRIRLV